jgi:hypothetical protein
MESPTTKRLVVSSTIISIAAVLAYLPRLMSLNLIVAMPHWFLLAFSLSPPPLFGVGIGNLFRRPVLGALLAALIYVLLCAISYWLRGSHFVPNINAL